MAFFKSFQQSLPSMSAVLESVSEKVDDLASALSDVTFTVSGELAEHVNTIIHKVQAEELKKIRKKEAEEKEAAARQAQERDPFLGRTEIQTQAACGLVKDSEPQTIGNDTSSLLFTETFSSESDLSQNPNTLNGKFKAQNGADSPSVLQKKGSCVKERTESTKLKTSRSPADGCEETKSSNSSPAEGERIRLLTFPSVIWNSLGDCLKKRNHHLFFLVHLDSFKLIWVCLISSSGGNDLCCGQNALSLSLPFIYMRRTLCGCWYLICISISCFSPCLLFLFLCKKYRRFGFLSLA